MAYGRYSKCQEKGSGGIRKLKQRKTIFKIKITLPDNTIKEFRTDEYNENKTIQRIKEKYGENIKIEKTLIEN